MSQEFSLEKRLNHSQQQFCDDDNKALRLLAPAGSGKTQTILWRCLAQYNKAKESGSSCRSLIFTFTKVARDELRDRLSSTHSFTPIHGFVEINTLNAWGFRLLKSRMHNPRLLTSSKDRIFLVSNDLQPVWQKHKAIKEVLTDSRRKNRFQSKLLDWFDSLKGLGFRHDQHKDFTAFCEQIKWLELSGLGSHVLALLNWLEDVQIIRKSDHKTRVMEAFENFFLFWCESVVYLFSLAKLSLEDQKYWALLELEQQLENKKFTTGSSRFHHIFVDEFQDINALDLNLLKMIAALNKTELTIVGDDDQAIYEWRGASPEFILRAEQFIGGKYTSHILNTNYRCPKNLVILSQQLIQNNQRRVPKIIAPAAHHDSQIEIISVPSVEVGVRHVAALVKNLLQRDDIKNIALISRKRSQIIPYQIIFAGEDIPFYAAEDLSILLSGTFEDLKEMLALKGTCQQTTRFSQDPTESLLKLCDKVKRFPLKKTERSEILKFVRSKNPRTLMQAAEYFSQFQGALKGDNVSGKMTAFFSESILCFLQSRSVSESILTLSECFEGMQKDYGKSIDDIFYVDPPFLYLSEYAKRYGEDLESFYDDVEKAIATLVRIPPGDSEDTDDSWKRKLHLLTSLRAKGKEFDVVIILDCNNGIWPSKLAKTEEQLEAERRIFYVACTRAKKILTMVLNQNMLGETVAPSPYIQEMGLYITSKL